MAQEIVKANDNAIDFAIPNGYICTLDMTTIDGKMAAVAALNGAQSMRDMVGETLRVKDFMTTPGVRSRTGEACINSYLICDDGNVYFTQSTGIAESLRYLAGAFIDVSTGKLMDLIESGIGLQIREQNLSNGNTLKTVVPVKL